MQFLKDLVGKVDVQGEDRYRRTYKAEVQGALIERKGEISYSNKKI